MLAFYIECCFRKRTFPHTDVYLQHSSGDRTNRDTYNGVNSYRNVFGKDVFFHIKTAKSKTE